MAADYETELRKKIEALNRDPAEIRHAVYELARQRIENQFWSGTPRLTNAERREEQWALEQASKRIEAEFVGKSPARPGALAGDPETPAEPPRKPVKRDVLVLQPVKKEAPVKSLDPEEPAHAAMVEQVEAALRERTEPARVEKPEKAEKDKVLIAAPLPPLGKAEPEEEPWPRRPAARKARTGRLALATLAIVATIATGGAAGYMVQKSLKSAPPAQANAPSPAEAKVAAVDPLAPPAPTPTQPAPAETNPLASAAPPPGSPSPAPPPAAPTAVPARQGVYAAHGSRLIELKPNLLAVPGPDSDSSLQKEPSQVTVPDGNVSFVIYKRGAGMTAPTKAMVYVVARIGREIVFSNNGPGKIRPVNRQWVIRNVGHEFRVETSPDNRDLVTVRPQAVDFVLPAGRHVLSYEGQNYDFTVDGTVVENSHCVERFMTTAAAYYSECPPADPAGAPRQRQSAAPRG